MHSQNSSQAKYGRLTLAEAVFYFEMSPEVAVAVLASLLAQLPNMSASCSAPRTTTEEFSHNVGGIVRETEDAVGI